MTVSEHKRLEWLLERGEVSDLGKQSHPTLMSENKLISGRGVGWGEHWEQSFVAAPEVRKLTQAFIYVCVCARACTRTTLCAHRGEEAGKGQNPLEFREHFVDAYPGP